MKNYLILIFLLSTCRLFSQEFNYCNYFSLEVSEYEYEGKMLKSYSPMVLKERKDKFSKFVDQHRLRYDYILFKDASKYTEIANYYPDLEKIKNEFCSNILNTPDIQKYFSSLSPNALVTWNSTVDTFSTEELMLVASKFFYCDQINQQDTTVQSHICVGINGQNEYKSNRDLILLEAFSIDAIFYYLDKKKEPLFITQFYNFKRKMAKEKRDDFHDFESYLLEIRTLCYELMQNNTDLKDKLLAYYNQNRSNLNFVIK